jgi:uncharacterized protein (DUF3820 family)
MAISFNKLKDPKLGLMDKLTFGKLLGCRVCDVVQDHYEYLIWCEKQGFVKFQQDVTDLILEQAHFERWKVPTGEDVVVDTYDKFNGYVTSDNWDDDIPF